MISIKGKRKEIYLQPSRFSALLLLSIVLILAACSPANLVSPEAIVVDDLGRSVNIEKIPQRIISLAPSNTEILFALGLGIE